MALKVQQHVVELEISVDDALFVQEDETWPDLGRVELGPGLGEAAAVLYVEHEITAVQVLHHEEQMGLGLEGAEQVAEVGMSSGQSQDFALDQRALDVVVLQHHVLLQALDGVDALGAAELRQQDLAEAALA